MKHKSIFLTVLILLLIGWKWPRPDHFLENVGIKVPKNTKFEHRSRWYLKSEAHFVKFTLPAPQAANLILQFSKKQRYEDVSANLKRHYPEFISGREIFSPHDLIPARWAVLEAVTEPTSSGLFISSIGIKAAMQMFISML